MDSSELLNAILSSAVDHAIIVYDRRGTIQVWNAGAEHTFGHAAHEAVGQDIGLIYTEADRALGVPRCERLQARKHARVEAQRWYRAKSGALLWAEGVTTPMFDRSGRQVGYMKILSDGTEKKRSGEEIVRLARVDPLTGLANRAEFQARLSEMAAAASRNGQLLILQLVDLDHFKPVNDRLGHAIGDQLLRQAAQRMQSAVRETDLVARLGGDEFVVLQPDARTPEVGGTVAEKLVDTLSRPFRIEGHQISIGASIGISVFPRDAVDPDQLQRKADLALYKVKAGTRDGWHYFTEQLDSRAHEKGRDLAQLRRAIKRRAFALQYQPQVDALSGCAVAVEALLRCTDARLAHYRPAELIELASDAGLMRELGEWILSEACIQARAWRDAGLPPVKLCLNLCTLELRNPRLPEQFDSALARAGLNGRDIEVEVTERQLFECGRAAGPILDALRARGICIVVDDFGSGYSSLRHLSNAAFDKIKLDRSFIEGVPHDAHSCSIASAIIGLAHSFDLDVVVEGVESAEQVQYLHREPCEALQGFFISEPLGADAMGRWLARQRTQALHS
ncbi:MAG TPA: EAL domain-containing protein [Lysobacter sp.]